MDNNFNSYKRYTSAVSLETRWATPDEIKDPSSSLHIRLDSGEKLPASGLPLFSDGNDVWVDPTDVHTLIFGATGSKKTRLFVMPTIDLLINAGESFIATDPKGELYERTSGYAEANGYDIKVLNFRDIGRGEMWNPLLYPYELYHKGEVNRAIEMLNDFAHTVTDRLIKGNADPFWQKSAEAFGVGCLLLMLESGTKDEYNVFSLARLCDFSKKRKMLELASHMEANSSCAASLNSIVNSADDTYKSVLISLYTSISVFINQKNLSAMLSQSTFNIKDFGEKKTAFYLIVPDEKTTTHFLVTSFVKQTYEMLIEQAQNEEEEKLPIRVNFVLDELCNIPEIPDLPNMISAARSRNMRFFLVAQSAHQLYDRYKENAHTIKGNCENWVFLASKELELLNEIRDLCGMTKDATGHPRYLISSSELQRLSKQRGEALILHTRCYPYVALMADIDEYTVFNKYRAPELPNITLPQFKVYDLDKVVEECKNGLRKYPFSSEDTTPADIKEILGYKVNF